MILLMGFTADADGRGDAEFQLTGEEAARVLRAMGEGAAYHSGCTVYVNILNEGLTRESCNDNSQERGDATLELWPTRTD